MQNFLEIAWHDRHSPATAHVVIAELLGGAASGGLRMRPGCTLDEVRGLARAMSLKEALHYRPGANYLPFGGAKGGIDYDPDAPDAQAVLDRFIADLRPILEAYWAVGEDLGIRQEGLDAAVTAAGLRSGVQAAYQRLGASAQTITTAEAKLASAAAVTSGGIGLDLLVGGRGVARAALSALAALDIPARGARAVIQGFGSMGGASARFLAEAGLRIVAVSDIDATIANPEGLDVEALLAARTVSGRIDRSALGPGDAVLERDAWLGIDCEVLVPAAVSYCITPDNQDRITAALIVEAANMPVLPVAESLLAARGVPVVPDFLANSATNAWWWWTLFGDVEPTVESAFAMIDRELDRLTRRAFELAGDHTVRSGALCIVEHNRRALAAAPDPAPGIAPDPATATTTAHATGGLDG